MWLLLDKQDLEQDRRLAQHILGVHQGIVQKVGCTGYVAESAGADVGCESHACRGARGQACCSPGPLQDETLGELVAPELLRAYISLARRQEPFVPSELSDYVVAHYCALRQRERDEMDGRTYVTPRTLLSILRLAQAVAKVRARASGQAWI